MKDDLCFINEALWIRRSSGNVARRGAPMISYNTAREACLRTEFVVPFVRHRLGSSESSARRARQQFVFTSHVGATPNRRLRSAVVCVNIVEGTKTARSTASSERVHEGSPRSSLRRGDNWRHGTIGGAFLGNNWVRPRCGRHIEECAHRFVARGGYYSLTLTYSSIRQHCAQNTF